MLQLYIPYLIAVASGMDMSTALAPDQTMVTQIPAVEATAPDKAAANVRTPEPQVPTGKFTTAVEVRPIVGMTKSNWVSVRLYEGQDLLYFTSLLTWRCGLWDIRYGINGAPADQVLDMEPCHEDTAQPNAMTDPATYPIWATFSGETIESVYIEVIFDDGTTDFARFDRSQILIP